MPKSNVLEVKMPGTNCKRPWGEGGKEEDDQSHILEVPPPQGGSRECSRVAEGTRGDGQEGRGEASSLSDWVAFHRLLRCVSPEKVREGHNLVSSRREEDPMEDPGGENILGHPTGGVPPGSRE